MGVIKSICSFLLLFFFMTFSYNHIVFSAEKGSDLIAQGATLKKVQSGFSWTEGPAADADGNIYFVDIPSERILKWTWADGKVTPYREKSAKSNGMIFDAKERLVICEMSNNRVIRDDLKGNITFLADSYNGKKLHMPNDLWIDSKGGIYFSDFAGGPGAEKVNEDLQVYYILPDGKTVSQATKDLVGPNGLIGTPDGKILYVTDPGAKKTYSYKINPDGTLTDRKLFCDQFTDGFKLDEKGNLYFSGDTGVTIYSPKGEKIGEIAMPEGCANLTFGGKDRKTLFIAARTSVYTLEMAVKGASTPLDLARGK